MSYGPPHPRQPSYLPTLLMAAVHPPYPAQTCVFVKRPCWRPIETGIWPWTIRNLYALSAPWHDGWWWTTSPLSPRPWPRMPCTIPCRPNCKRYLPRMPLPWVRLPLCDRVIRPSRPINKPGYNPSVMIRPMPCSHGPIAITTTATTMTAMVLHLPIPTHPRICHPPSKPIRIPNVPCPWSRPIGIDPIPSMPRNTYRLSTRSNPMPGET
mmetsp:Transcript_4187/g.8520  ORF Transcript_4187/g.8520 Transcript_4187/m.8520 type:complete len:210 (-) Transcript_4187:314-943(-)